MKLKELLKSSQISKRLNRMIVLMVFVASFLGLANSTYHYVKQMIINFYDTSLNVAEAASGISDMGRVIRFSEDIFTDEFQKIAVKAKETNDYAALNERVQNSEEYRYIYRISRYLYTLETFFDTEDVMLVACKGDACYYAVPTVDSLETIGQKCSYPISNTNTDDDFQDNIDRIDAESGNLLTWVPYDNEEPDEIRIFAGCSMNTNKFRNELITFLFHMMIYLILVTAICAFIGTQISQKRFAMPIVKLKSSAEEFTKENSSRESAVPVDPAIKTKDEIQDLSNSLYNLEVSVVQTQEKLRAESIEKGRMQSQLSIAREIQNGALPARFPMDEEIDLYAVMHPAKEVGGDFYDFFRTDGNCIVLVIGDVSDKGIPAALFMMAAKTMIRSAAMREKDPAAVLELVNNALIDINTANMFVTIWIGILDLDTGLLKAANAGHEYPLLSVNGGPFTVYKDPHGIVAGTIEDAKYKTYTIQLRPTDRMLVYSDGATDALNTDGKAINLDGLVKLANSVSRNNVKHTVLEIQNGILHYFKGTSQFDDITLLEFSYLGFDVRDILDSEDLPEL